MTVSRSGKRGALRMIPASRNRRVRVNAGVGSMVGDIVRPGAKEWTFRARNIDEWNPDIRPANGNDNISPDALKHGRYEVADTFYRKNVLEAEYTPLVVNRAVTVIDDWIDGDVFYGYQIRVIERTRDLWRAVKRPRHPFYDPYDPEELEDGFESGRAKALLHRCRRLVGDQRWNIFENVVRWNEPTGIPGSRIARVSEASIAAAQSVVRGVASEVGKARVI